MANIDHFRAILGSQKGISGLLNWSLGLSATVGWVCFEHSATLSLLNKRASCSVQQAALHRKCCCRK